MHGANHSGHRRSVLQRPAQGSFTSACAAAAAVDLDLSVTGPLTQSYIWSLNCFLGGLTGAWGPTLAVIGWGQGTARTHPSNGEINNHLASCSLPDPPLLTTGCELNSSYLMWGQYSQKLVYCFFFMFWHYNVWYYSLFVFLQWSVLYACSSPTPLQVAL